MKCDRDTTTQADIDLGIVNILVGFAPLKPAEFVVIQHPADGRACRPREPGGVSHGAVQCQRPAVRSVQELQVPGEVGRPLRRRASARSVPSSAPPRSSSIARAAIPSTSRKSPGRTKYEAITLERGVTHDLEFERWANKVWNFGSGLGAEVSLKDFRKDLILELYNEAGQLVIAYKIFRAGSRSSRPCRTSMPTPTPSRSRPSSSRTRAGSATSTSSSRASRPSSNPDRRDADAHHRRAADRGPARRRRRRPTGGLGRSRPGDRHPRG